jgi:hypothetical protein
MTEIEKTEGEIKVLQAKLELLKEMENHKSPAEEAYKRVYNYSPPTSPYVSNFEDTRWRAFELGYRASQEDYKVGEYQPSPQTPEQVADGLRDAMRQAKEEGVFDEPSKPMDEIVDRMVKKYQAQKLWNRVRDELGYSIDLCDEIVDLVEKWLPEPQSAAGSQNVDVEFLVDGFNDCVRKMNEMLR